MSLHKISQSTGLEKKSEQVIELFREGMIAQTVIVLVRRIQIIKTYFI